MNFGKGIVEWQDFIEKCYLVIVNLGKRPVTIQQIIVKVIDNRQAKVDFIVGDREGIHPPFMLTYGESEAIALDDEAGLYVIHSQYGIKVDILIYDSEGDEYRPTLKRLWDYNERDYSEFEKLEKAKSRKPK